MLMIPVFLLVINTGSLVSFSSHYSCYSFSYLGDDGECCGVNAAVSSNINLLIACFCGNQTYNFYRSSQAVYIIGNYLDPILSWINNKFNLLPNHVKKNRK